MHAHKGAATAVGLMLVLLWIAVSPVAAEYVRVHSHDMHRCNGVVCLCPPGCPMGHAEHHAMQTTFEYPPHCDSSVQDAAVTTVSPHLALMMPEAAVAVTIDDVLVGRASVITYRPVSPAGAAIEPPPRT